MDTTKTTVGQGCGTEPDQSELVAASVLEEFGSAVALIPGEVAERQAAQVAAAARLVLASAQVPHLE